MGKEKLLLCVLIFILIFIYCLACNSRLETSKPSTTFYADNKETIDSLLYNCQYQRAVQLAVHHLENNKTAAVEDTAYTLYVQALHKQYTGQYDSAMHYFDLAYNTAFKTNNLVLKATIGADYLFNSSRAESRQNVQDRVYQFVESVDLKNIPDTLAKANVLAALGSYYGANGIREKYLSTLTDERIMREEYLRTHSATQKDSNALGFCYILLADAEWFLARNTGDTILKYLQMGRPLVENYKFGKAQFYATYLFWCKDYLKDMDKANLYCDSIVALAPDAGENIYDWVLGAKVTMADYYFYHTNNLTMAWKYSLEAKKYEDLCFDAESRSHLNWLISDLYLKEHNYKVALKYLVSIQNDVEKWTRYYQMNFWSSVAGNYGALGMPDSFSKYYNKLREVSDKYYDTKSQSALAMAEAKYKTHTKQLKIEEQRLTIQYSQRQQVWLVAGIALLLLVATLLLIIYRLKRKTAIKLNVQNEKLEELNAKLDEANRSKSKLFGIISHDLRSPISQVYQFLQLQRDNFLSQEEHAILEKETHDVAGSLLDTMENLLVWSKTQLDAINPAIGKVNIGLIVKQCEDLLRLNIQTKNIKIIKHISDADFVETDFNFLQTIIRNLLQNAINASPNNGEIEIKFTEKLQQQKPLLYIKNNGNLFTHQNYLDAVKGIKSGSQLHSGMGFKVVDELCQKINVNIEFDSYAKNGSCCLLMFNS